MSVEMNILFEATGGLEDVAAQLESVLGIRLQRTQDGAGCRYEYHGLGIQLVLFRSEGFEDSGGIPFTRYAFVLDVLPIRSDVDEDQWWSLMYYTAMYCFARITRTLRWSTIVLHDLQSIEAEFDG